MKAPPRYFWQQNYEIGNSLHWALNDTYSTQEGKISCCYMVLFAEYPTCMDGRSLSEQTMPKTIIDLLNADSESTATVRERNELRTKLAQVEADRDREAAKVDKLTTEHAALHTQTTAQAGVIEALTAALSSLVSSKQAGARILDSQWACASAALLLAQKELTARTPGGPTP